MTTLLTYSIDTRPNPLQASKPGAIDIVISNMTPEDPVTLTSVSIAISVGSTAADLIEPGSTAISVSGPTGWDTRMDGSACKATPSQPVTVAAAGFVISLSSIPVNAYVGKTTLYISETAATATEQKKLRTGEVDVAKFPAVFTLSDLKATPKTIHSGESTSLMWTGTNLGDLVTYKLSYVTGGKPVEISVGYIGPRTVEHLTTEPITVFTLTASVGGGQTLRQFAIDVLPSTTPPQLEELSGTFSGDKLTIRWKAKNAEYCLLNTSSARQEIEGSTAAFTPDRLCYTVTAVKGSLTTKRELRLFTQSVVDVRPSMPTGSPFTVSRDGSLVVIGVIPTQAYEGSTLKLRREVGTLPAYAVYAAINSDRSRLFLAGHNAAQGFANLYNVADLALITQKNLGFVDAVTYSPDARSIFVAVTKDKSILKIDSQSLQTQKTYTFAGGEGSGLCCSPDGATLYVTESDTLVAIDVASGTRGRTVVLGTGPLGMPPAWPALTFWEGPGTTRYLIAGSTDLATKLIDPATFTVVETLAYQGNFGVTAAELLFWDFMEGKLKVYDLASRSVKQTLDAQPSQQFAEIQVRFGGGSMFTYETSGPHLRTHAIVRAEAGPPVSGRSVRESGRRAYIASSSDSTLVLVSPHDNGGVTAVDVAIEATDAQPPAGWSVVRGDHGFAFTRLGGAADGMLVFTFRDAKGTPRVTERSGEGARDVEITT